VVSSYSPLAVPLPFTLSATADAGY
jgi:hypothetical protein